MQRLKEILMFIFGSLFYFVMAILVILPIYATIKDLMNDKILYGILDLFTVIVGVIRGIMYFFGWL